MITIRLKNTEELTACDINELEAELDEENQEINIYYNDRLLGQFCAVYGINEDDFISQIKHKEVTPCIEK